MPRFIRPAWINVDVDGRRSRIGTGPRARCGRLHCILRIRSNGSIVDALSLGAGGDREGLHSDYSIRLDTFAVAYLPNGKEMVLPKGTAIRSPFAQ